MTFCRILKWIICFPFSHREQRRYRFPHHIPSRDAWQNKLLHSNKRCLYQRTNQTHKGERSWFLFIAIVYPFIVSTTTAAAVSLSIVSIAMHYAATYEIYKHFILTHAVRCFQSALFPSDFTHPDVYKIVCFNTLDRTCKRHFVFGPRHDTKREKSFTHSLSDFLFLFTPFRNSRCLRGVHFTHFTVSYGTIKKVFA